MRVRGGDTGILPVVLGLILMGASLIGVGLLVRWAVGARARALGTMLVVIGAVILVVGLGLTALVISSR